MLEPHSKLLSLNVNELSVVNHWDVFFFDLLVRVIRRSA